MKRARLRRRLKRILRHPAVIASIAVLVCCLGYQAVRLAQKAAGNGTDPSAPAGFVIPVYDGAPYAEINGNEPFFTDLPLTAEAYEDYSPLDSLGRCGPATACLGPETMPAEERGPIGMITPSGWQTVRYDDLIEDKYLYNRCHLIAYILSGENDNPLNLITGTRYLNTAGMLPFEVKVADYILATGNHVLYRVTPVFQGDDLVAGGVLIEAMSVEDRGSGVRFNVYVFNVQPGIEIDYRTGESQRAPSP